jgi:hypothetical protein
VSIDHRPMECKMRSRSQWDRKLRDNGTFEYFDCCHHDMIVCVPFYARHTNRRWVSPVALRLTNRRSCPHGSHDWRRARPMGECPHTWCVVSQSYIDRVATRIGNSKPFWRHPAGRPRPCRRPRRPLGAGVSPGAPPPPARPAAQRRAGAHGLDRPRCWGGIFQRGFYTHFKGDSTRATG